MNPAYQPTREQQRADETEASTPQQERSPHYGGPDDPYEAIKVIRAWNLDPGFSAGNVVKYVRRYCWLLWDSGARDQRLNDLRKARTYIDFLIERERG